MIRRIYQRTGGDHLGFSDGLLRYVVDFAQGPRLKELAAGANRHSALIDRESGFDRARVLRVTGFEPTADGAWALLDGAPSGLLLTRVELATLAAAMPSGR